MHNLVVYPRQRTQRFAVLCQLTHAVGLVPRSCSWARIFDVGCLPTVPQLAWSSFILLGGVDKFKFDPIDYGSESYETDVGLGQLVIAGSHAAV